MLGSNAVFGSTPDSVFLPSLSVKLPVEYARDPSNRSDGVKKKLFELRVLLHAETQAKQLIEVNALQVLASRTTALQSFNDASAKLMPSSTVDIDRQAARDYLLERKETVADNFGVAWALANDVYRKYVASTEAKETARKAKAAEKQQQH